MDVRRAPLRLLPLCLTAILLAGCSDSAADSQDPGTPPPPVPPQLRCAPEPAAADGAAALESACARRTETAA